VPICFAVVMLFIEILYRFGDNGGEIMHVKHLLVKNQPCCLKCLSNIPAQSINFCKFKKFLGKETPRTF
jgi:hypothetical protein